MLHCFKKPFSCKSTLFNWKKLYYYQWNASTVKLSFTWARGTACDIPGNCTAPSYWPLKSVKVSSKTYWLSMWPAWTSQQPGKILVSTLYPEVLNPHHHHWTPLEKGWAPQADNREKSSCSPVENCKRKVTGPIHQHTQVQLFCRPGNTLTPICLYIHICIHIHISASDGTSAHNQPQGEGNMRRDTCSHHFSA